MMKYLLILFVFLTSQVLFSQCDEGESKIRVNIIADDFPQDISWKILTYDGRLIYESTSLNESYCVPSNACYTFILEDSYGDGMMPQGFIHISYDDENVMSSSGFNYGFSHELTMGCGVGMSCSNPLEVTEEGSFEAPQANSWYEFFPSETGRYQITTCGLNTCDTKIWIYETCNSSVFRDDNEGTIFYDDNSGGCGDQAVVNAFLDKNKSYLIRIGTSSASCSGEINWAVSYEGPIEGCMNPDACNYDPLATVSGDCVFPGDPDCQDGPDLYLREDAIINSFQISTEFINDQCMVQEGCANGYGQRELIRFDTWIDNIGTKDYYVGTPESNPDQFSYTNCHGHAHYEGYAEYILWNDAGERIPIGFKSGFCVMDLTCDWGTAKYGCQNMGITAGCGDIYNARLDCQWIDVTDIPDGDYELVVRTNWNRRPDALGRQELRFDNNVAQVCFNLSRGSHGPIIELSDCQEIAVDCLGAPYGDATEDCEGICAGTAIKGDLDKDLELDQIDVNQYIDAALNGNTSISLCNDLNEDGALTVFDASLLSNCNNNSSNMDDLCDFPRGAENPFQTTYYQIDEVNFEEGYLDLSINNPYNQVMAFQLELSGIEASRVESFVDLVDADMSFHLGDDGKNMIGICFDNSSLNRSTDYKKVCRVFFDNLTGEEVCIENVVATINDNVEQTLSENKEDCFTNVSISSNQIVKENIKLYPNPVKSKLYVEIDARVDEDYTVDIYDVLGKQLKNQKLSNNESVLEIDINDLRAGVYKFVLKSERQVLAKTFVVE